MTAEFALIQRYFSDPDVLRPDVLLGVGDDCAVLSPPAGKQLLVSMDTLNSGVHFFADVDPFTLGHKSLAVGLSDLAAMGAEPAWATLALSLPAVDDDWLEAFAQGFAQLAQRYQVQLIGGDTTRGALSISVQVHGFAVNRGLRRSAARAGDLIYVSGTLGDAALALHQYKQSGRPQAALMQRLQQPQPRVELGLAIADFAHACIDLSDGLTADLGHILSASQLGASIHQPDLPLSAPVRRHVEQTTDWSLPLSGGDDYELCFTLPPAQQSRLEALRPELDCELTCIGRIEAHTGLRLTTLDAGTQTISPAGYQHFRESV
ncbi:MAG: thiamine-phosphate kinase [gamma proteobacterium symbiont of Bathyaustriella thionipta]|nr:thiamine-phosphate kinase [gamma proteobacterium symbiont of Bathyaustriella thionipta]